MLTTIKSARAAALEDSTYSVSGVGVAIANHLGESLMSKRINKPKLRKELRDLLEFIEDKVEFAIACDDTDAVDLEHMAHLLEGIGSDCNKAADMAGALAMAIDPEVADKI